MIGAQTRDVWARMLRERASDEPANCCLGYRLESAARLIGFFRQLHVLWTIPVSLFLVLGLMKSPSVRNAWTDATAPPKAIEVGRMMATGPSFWSRKWAGSGMIKLDCKVSPFKDLDLSRAGQRSTWKRSRSSCSQDRRPSREWNCRLCPARSGSAWPRGGRCSAEFSRLLGW